MNLYEVVSLILRDAKKGLGELTIKEVAVASSVPTSTPLAGKTSQVAELLERHSSRHSEGTSVPMRDNSKPTQLEPRT